MVATLIHSTIEAPLGGLEVADVSRHERLTAMREGRLGSVHSWELVTAVDGPGTRLTTFLSGCPLQCLYCHNPDTHEAAGGREMSVQEVMDEVLRCQPYFGSRGGLTLSGGEPLAQAKFAAELFARCRRYRVHTALDTSGCLAGAAVRTAVERVDLVLLDVKDARPDRYRELTGGTLKPGQAVFELDRVKEFLALLDELDKPFWVRQVIVPGWNDSEGDMDALGDLLRPHKTLQRVELLPFRSLGRWKYERLGRTFALADTPEAAPRHVEDLERYLKRSLNL